MTSTDRSVHVADNIGNPRIKWANCCVQAKGDEDRQFTMYPDYCLKAMGDVRSPCPMIAERCVQATVDASSLRRYRLRMILIVHVQYLLAIVFYTMALWEGYPNGI